MGLDTNLLRFVRQQLQAQWCCALGSGVVFSVTGGLGVTVPWGEAWRTRSTCISDRSATNPCEQLSQRAEKCTLLTIKFPDALCL